MLRLSSFELTLTQWQGKIAVELSALWGKLTEEENKDKPSESKLEKLGDKVSNLEEIADNLQTLLDSVQVITSA